MNLIGMFIKRICGKQGFSLSGAGQAFPLTAGIHQLTRGSGPTPAKERCHKPASCPDLDPVVYCSVFRVSLHFSADGRAETPQQCRGMT